MGKLVLLNATRGPKRELPVHALNLRPVGLEVFADKQGLHVMGSAVNAAEVHGLPVVMVCSAA